MSCNPLGSPFTPEWADKRAIVVVQENATVKYIGVNPNSKEFSLFKIDGYVIATENKAKCDYLLIRCLDSHCFFIELKGSDLVHAANQIIETINTLKTKLTGHVLNARIILSRTTSLSMKHANIRTLQKIVNETGGNLIHSNIQLKETL